jgi:hypothetical protein
MLLSVIFIDFIVITDFLWKMFFHNFSTLLQTGIRNFNLIVKYFILGTIKHYNFYILSCPTFSGMADYGRTPASE